MAAEWFALRSKPRKDKVLYQHVNSQNIECFYPRIRVNPVNPRSAKVRSYFPGYMFVRVDGDEVGISTFKWMPFSYGLVSFGDEPATVPTVLITTLMKKFRESKFEESIKNNKFKPGNPVQVIDGPFQGYDAIFDAQIDGKDRVRILIEILNDSHMRVELSEGQIKSRDK